ncbi:MAG: thiol reductant ABC exporter subunit CydD, partial [Brachybacterium sp.]|nr:thiol reductant ABC exporter subunit CydD [Brachybacterium sp.]
MTTAPAHASSPAAPDVAPPRRRARPPIDPRLIRQVQAARGHLALAAALGLVQAACVIAVALLLGTLGARLLITGELPTDAPAMLIGLAAALTVRALAVFVEQRTAHRAATATIAELRSRLVAHAGLLGPRRAAGRGADVTALATTGIENIRPYLVGYVPQLMLTATVTPLALAVILWLDLTSGLIILGTLPLIPLFMILIGQLTVGRSARLLADMRRLWTQMLDLVDGLPTLRALGRERGPERTVRTLGERHLASTMGSLRYAFLSSMALEFLATLSVALIAVSIGLRLVYGGMDLGPAIAILVLAPEAYLPLRMVGQQFHASTDGLAAVDATFEVLEERPEPDGRITTPDLATAYLALEGVAVRSRDGLAPADATLTLRPGRVLALTGSSGAGKTTAALCLMGLIAPTAGRAVVRSDHPGEHPKGSPQDTALDVADLRRSTLWSQISYLPQRPVIGTGTLRSILSAAAPAADDARIEEAARAAGLQPVIADRGWDAPVGRGGVGLSLGERQRLALARAVLTDAPVVVLDEPTAHLDGAAEA